MAEMEKEQEFIEYVVKALVDNPDKVTLTRTVDERGVLLELSVDPEDMGKIIGKAGATAKAIRTLLRVLGAKDDARYNLKIVEPEGSEYQPRELSDESQDSVENSSSEANEQVVDSEEEVSKEDPQETSEENNQEEDDERVAKAREGIEDLDSDI